MTVLALTLYFNGRPVPVEVSIIWEPHGKDGGPVPTPGEVQQYIETTGAVLGVDGAAVSWNAERVEYMEVRAAEVEVG